MLRRVAFAVALLVSSPASGVTHQEWMAGVYAASIVPLRSVAIVGDSLVQRTDWNLLLNSECAPYIINRGIGGIASGGVRVLMAPVLLGMRPRAVIVWVGVNDTHDLTAENIDSRMAEGIASYKLMVSRLRLVAPELILVTVGPTSDVLRNRMIVALNEAIRSVADEGKLVDAYDFLVGSGGMIRPEFTTDGVHLNAAGYRAVRREFLKAVRRLGPCQ